jgi:glutamate racemase
MKRRIAFIHASPAAIAPLAGFYAGAAPELEITNLLDDGILRSFRSRDERAVRERLGALMRIARDAHGAELALLTCSAASPEVMDGLRRAFDFPVLKIDEEMARRSASAGRRVGVVVTFAPTLEATEKLLREAAAEAGREVELVTEFVPEAHQLLLGGDERGHDELLRAAVNRLGEQNVDAVVLAQVSMARVAAELGPHSKTPLLTSLDTSLDAIRRALQETR